MTHLLRPAKEGDFKAMMAIGHEAIRPHIEAIRGWDRQMEERVFLTNPARHLYARLGFMVYDQTHEHLYMVFFPLK